MKRFKYILLAIIFIFTIGCQDKSIEMVQIENNVVENKEDYSIDSSTDATEDNQIDTTADVLYDAETIRKILAEKFSCDTPPFYTVFDHEDEDGLYVYHVYESVTNDDESHIATIDWVTVDPKTGEATTLFGETFNIGDYAANDYEEGSPEYLFNQFLKGEIDAKVLNPLEPKEWGWDYEKIETVNINDLNEKHILWSFMEYSEGERLDLDNDGENELIIDGPYGGMYLDVIDGTLYVFAAARGNAGGLKYTYYDNAYWIVYHDTTHGGRCCYWLYKYEGADKLVDSMTLMGFWNSEDDKEFTFNGESITEDDYNRIHDEIFKSKDKE